MTILLSLHRVYVRVSLQRDTAIFLHPLRHVHALGILPVGILASELERHVHHDLLAADGDPVAAAGDGARGLEGEGDAVVGPGHHLTLHPAEVVQLDVAIVTLETGKCCSSYEDNFYWMSIPCTLSLLSKKPICPY